MIPRGPRLQAADSREEQVDCGWCRHGRGPFSPAFNYDHNGICRKLSIARPVVAGLMSRHDALALSLADRVDHVRKTSSVRQREN